MTEENSEFENKWNFRRQYVDINDMIMSCNVRKNIYIHNHIPFYIHI